MHMTVGSLPGHLARRFHQLSTALFDLEMRRSEIDLTPVQYAALVTVEDNPAIDQATLASLIAYDRTTTGGVVDRLVDKHLVTTGYLGKRPAFQGAHNDGDGPSDNPERHPCSV